MIFKKSVLLIKIQFQYPTSYIMSKFQKYWGTGSETECV